MLRHESENESLLAEGVHMDSRGQAHPQWRSGSPSSIVSQLKESHQVCLPDHWGGRLEDTTASHASELCTRHNGPSEPAYFSHLSFAYLLPWMFLK